MKILNYIISITIGLQFISCGNSSTEQQSIKKIDKTIVKNGIATSTFTVWGNCGMCEETIEKSLKLDGISKADWNSDSKIIVVDYDTSKVTLDEIQKTIASVGYDNIKYKGEDRAYAELHECCKYDRK
ncbi:MAG: heavy-metal-associated domain-containing protein [Flavobacteriia bacterium]|nr:heavy-metal-associated domain-containing protein [Flavobacteriia bacterium]